LGNGGRIGTRNPNYTNAARATGRGDGSDGIG